MVTGVLDSLSWVTFPELREPGVSIQLTGCTHIFAEFTNDGMDDEQKVPTLLC